MGIVSVDQMIIKHSLFAILSYAIIGHLVAPIAYYSLNKYSILEINLTKCERISTLGGNLASRYIFRLGSFLGVQNFEFQYFLGFSEK